MIYTIKSICASWKAYRARSKFSRVGLLAYTTPTGRQGFVYLYENARGKRKVKATHSELRDKPAVVIFLEDGADAAMDIVARRGGAVR